MRARQFSKAADPAWFLADSERPPRIILERDVVLRLPNLPDRLRGSSANISATGMFVRCQDLQPVGRTLSFELRLSPRKRRIRGRGEVVWSRRFNLGTDLPAGMGIRFLHIDEESRLNVRSITGDGSPEANDAGVGFSRPPSGLTSTQFQKLHSYAGFAVAKPERTWPRRLHSLFSQTASRIGL